MKNPIFESQSVYLDNNAATKIDPKVLEVMCQELSGPPSNPSSIHLFGRQAKEKLILARQSLANFFTTNPENLIFTSGGTEAVNLALRGFLTPLKGAHVISTDIEHASVYNTLLSLNNNLDITYLKPGAYGAPLVSQIEQAIKSTTKLIVVSAVNAETGVMIDLEEIAQVAIRHNIALFVDGVALLGKKIFQIPKGVSAMAFSSHKIHGPHGIGLLYLKKEFKISPLLTGGPQEKEKRAGTENLAAILGFVKAIELINEEHITTMQTLKDQFENILMKKLKISINGLGPRVCNISNICFHGIDGETLLINLDQNGILASLGSACSSGIIGPSRILINMGLSKEDASSSLRFSFSRFNTEEDVKKATDTLIKLAMISRK
jgi:cysteine desulfurase